MVSRRFPVLPVALMFSLGLTWLACADLMTLPASPSLSITPKHDTLNSVGDSLQLFADAVYSDGDPAAGLKWVSLDEFVVAVDQMGMARAVGKGAVMVEVSVADMADTATLVVLAAEALQDGVPATSLSGVVGSKQFFKFTVPIGSSAPSTALQSFGAASDPSQVTDVQDAVNAAASSSLRVTTTAGTGDISLYVRFGDVPTSSDSDCESARSGNDEACEFADPAAGDWYVLVRGADEFQGVTLTAQLSESTALGVGLAQGLLAVHDGTNDSASAPNVKYVPWASVAAALGRRARLARDPRTVGR